MIVQAQAPCTQAQPLIAQSAVQAQDSQDLRRQLMDLTNQQASMLEKQELLEATKCRSAYLGEAGPGKELGSCDWQARPRLGKLARLQQSVRTAENSSEAGAASG